MAERTDQLDWAKIRANAFADSDPPPNWPPHVNVISVKGLALFGLDDQHRAYWDGKLIEVRSGITLTRWQRIGAVLTVLAALIAASGASISAYVSLQSYLDATAVHDKER